MPKKDAKNIGGFTLLEILIALSILATVIAIVFGSYTQTFRNIEGAESQAEIYQMARIALERIKEDLECSLISEDGSTSDGFSGKDDKIDDRDADTLYFLSKKHLSLDDEDGYSGSARIAFYILEDDEEEGFVLYRSDTLKYEEIPEEKAGGLILCEGLHSVNFTYYNSDGDEYESWDSSGGEFKDRLPAMVSIQLEFVIKSRPDEPLKFVTSIALPMAKDKYGA
jgi:prepilin-type N-terminal cleavage/methylation domain-containing protein